jgi:hypothetical protein
MKFSTATIAAAAAASTASASSIFGVQSRHSTAAVHLSSWKAANSGIFNLLPEQGASCDRGEKLEYATFRLDDEGALHLYKNDNPPQQLYVDRSGMGQGKIGFTTGVQPTPRNAERTGWAVDADGHLNFDGSGFLACPGYADGAWEIWLAGVSDHPGYNYNCTGVQAAVIEISTPVGCLYVS